MCRIAGIIDPRRYQDQLSDESNTMINTMINGGPDGRGEIATKLFSIAHCRLSIIDLSNAASQPFCDNETGNIISYNGEIYNYKELRIELEKLGQKFYSNSDTEVVLKAYNQWGIKSFSRFNGMFAFCIFDKLNNNIILSRDSIGIKPLYYFLNNEQLIFASEVRAFKQLLTEEFEYWKVLFLTYGFIPEPYTKLKDVYSLEPGSIIEFNLNTFTTSKSKFKFESLSKINFKSQFDTEIIKYKLFDAVERHLISDAEIGMFLSGGIDSSILTLIASTIHNKINTLSIHFEEIEYSEKKFQDIIASATNSKHKSFQLNKITFDNHVEEIFNDYDLPSNDGVNTWFISKYASDYGLKAVLSGLGADEIFGGYPSFKRLKYLLVLKKNKYVNFLSKINFSKFQRLEFLLLDKKISDYLLLRGFYTPTYISKILGLSKTEILEILNQHIPNSCIEVNNIQDIANLEKEVYMRNQLLRDSDVMGMRHGIEIRVPFLDQELISSINQLNENIIYSEPGKKTLLINLFKDILPVEIWDRPKKGFQFPFKDWLKESEFVKSKISSLGMEYQYKLFLHDKIHWSKVWTLIQL